MLRRIAVLGTLLLAGCGSDDAKTATQTPARAVDGTKARFALDHAPITQETFYDLPYPSDLRVNADGSPDMRGYPNPDDAPLVSGLIELAAQSKGFPTVSTAYFRFDAAMAPGDVEAVIAGDASSPILLVDVDPKSAQRGKLYPTVAVVVPDDAFLPANTLAVAPRPGVVLHPERTYAFVVMRSLHDASGKALGSSLAFEQVKAGQTPDGSLGAMSVTAYRPLWDTLTALKVDTASVAAATVFTTGDVIKDLATLTDKMMGVYDLEIQDLTLDANGGPAPADGEQRVCEIHANVTYPQFQVGTPPFDTDGLFTFGADGLPVKQRDEIAPIVLTIPRAEMPAAGTRWWCIFTGPAGSAPRRWIAGRGDRKRRTTGARRCPQGTTYGTSGSAFSGGNTKGTGPAYVVAKHGFATVASALPLNPERLEGASDTAYLSINNPKSFHDTFRQGVFEQRMLLRAIAKLEIPASVVAGCTGAALPSGATSYKFDTSRLIAQGQSMGGMYTNLVSAVEPMIKASVPTGAGGLWSYFVMKTPLFGGLAQPLSNVVGAPLESFTFTHPTMALLEAAWETSDPIVAVPRLALNPLPGHPVRPIYEPCAKGDSFFAMLTYDAMALAYGNERAGDAVWPTMDDALATDGRTPIAFPVTNNLTSGGTPYTGVVVQFEGDGVYDPHAIYSQRDDVKHQYSCFMQSFQSSGIATVPAKGGIDDSCAP